MQPFASYYSQDRRNTFTQQTCAECGDKFQTRASNEAAEVLCDACYSAQFEPVRVPMWQRVAHNLRRQR
jgi:NMD protein affecting ribosome stability and mRNA decay